MQVAAKMHIGSSRRLPRACSLDSNNIGLEGAGALAEALKENATVTTL